MLHLRALVLFLVAVAASACCGMCGNLTLPLSKSLINVLIVGDSISVTPVSVDASPRLSPRAHTHPSRLAPRAQPYTPGGYGGALEALLASHGIYAQHAGGEFDGGQAYDSGNGVICTNHDNPGGCE